MSGVLVIAGYGRGISNAVAIKFGKERGYSLALLCRSKDKLDEAVKRFEGLGVKTIGVVTDLSDTNAVLESLRQVKETAGDIGLLHWNCGGGPPKPLLEMTMEELRCSQRMNVDNLLAATKFVLDDLEKLKGAVLVTGGSLGDHNEEMAQLALAWGSANWAITSSSSRKLVHLLHLALKPQGVFVGEVTVRSIVKGTDADRHGNATLLPETVADLFAKLLDDRGEPFASAQSSLSHVPQTL